MRTSSQWDRKDPEYTAPPAIERSAISHFVSGHMAPNHDWTVTTPMAARWAKRNQGFLTQDHDCTPPMTISVIPATIKATNKACSSRMKSAAIK